MMREWQYHLERPQLSNQHFDDATALMTQLFLQFSAGATALRDFKADTHRIAVAFQQILASQFTPDTVSFNH